MSIEATEAAIAEVLRAAGCVAAEEEAAELLAAAAGSGSDLATLVERRAAGEPLAWVTGSVRFCGYLVHVDPGVYVPRWQSECIAHEAARRLPADGVAVDLCTGSGAIAAVLHQTEPAATVLATDADERAVSCARRNGVDALLGHLDEPLPSRLSGHVDVIVAVAPYVPTDRLEFLPRDVLAFEPIEALDGGDSGLVVVGEIVEASPRWLCPGGSLVLECGADQASDLEALLHKAGFVDVEPLHDGDGDLRGLAARAGQSGRVDPPAG